MKILSAGRFMVGFSWAKSLLWHDATTSGRVISLVAIAVIDHRSGNRAIRVILGPVSILFGWVK